MTPFVLMYPAYMGYLNFCYQNVISECYQSGCSAKAHSERPCVFAMIFTKSAGVTTIVHLFTVVPTSSGRNSRFSAMPIPASRRCKIRMDGFRFLDKTICQNDMPIYAKEI